MLFILFFFSLLLSLLFTPLAKRAAIKLGIIDQPGHRKIHDRPTPLTGGPAIFLAAAIPLGIAYYNCREYWGLVLFGALFILFGLLDDKGITMRARYKIWAHLMFSIACIYFSGLHFEFFKVAWLNWALTACFITFMTNSMNMLDGMDGLVSGITFICAGFFAILALNSNQTNIVYFSIAIMGATLGFLRYNFNPASIFLGESGSTFLGFVLAILSIKLNIYGLWNVALSLGLERLQIISFIVPLILLGIPIFDTYFVFINRFLHRVKFSQPGKDHSHHRIHLMGYSQKSTVLTLYAIQVILGSISLSMVRADMQQLFSLLLIVAVFFVTFTMFLTRVKVYE